MRGSTPTFTSGWIALESIARVVGRFAVRTASLRLRTHVRHPPCAEILDICFERARRPPRWTSAEESLAITLSSCRRAGRSYVLQTDSRPRGAQSMAKTNFKTADEYIA